MAYSPLEQFELLPLLPLHRGSLDFSLTNSALRMILSSGLVLVFFSLATARGNGTLVPNRYQSLLESIYERVLGMVQSTLGSAGAPFFPFVFTLFTFLLSANMRGMVPYSFTVTSHLIVTITFARAIWIGKLLMGFRLHGLALFGLFLPAGAPMFMVPFLVAIEILGFFITVISLSVRLFANMMAGHILLKVMAGFAWTMMMAGGVLFLGHFLPLVVLFLLLGLETAVAFIQAYVFALLTCIYIGDCLSGGH